MPAQEKTVYIPVCDGGCKEMYQGWNDYIPYFDTPADVRNEIDDHEDYDSGTWVRIGDTYWCGTCRYHDHVYVPGEDPKVCGRCRVDADEHDPEPAGVSA